ncbi:MAG: phage major capsid protein, partial [Pseudomonadota bacterium]
MTNEIFDADPQERVNAAGLRNALGEFLNAFEHFKEANDTRLAAIESRSADVLLEEKVDRINRALDEQKSAVDKLALNARRPQIEASDSPAFDERKTAFHAYMRSGDTRGVHEIEGKAVSLSGPPDAGYLAPEDTSSVITTALKTLSPMRRIASVREIGSNVFRKPISQGDIGVGWVAETANRPTTDTPTLSALDFQTMELYAAPAASQTLLDDAVIDIEQWLAEEVQAEFSVQESAAFVNGNGSTQPKGFLQYTITAEASRTASEIGYVATGVDGDFPANDPHEILLDLIYTPKQAYRANGRFAMNRSVISTIREFKDADGNYIWQPPAAAGEDAGLFGYPVTELEDMPAIGLNANAVAFG